MAPIPMTFTDDASQLISAIKRRQTDLLDFQIPRLQTCKGPLSLQQNLAAELREDIDTYERQVKDLELFISDQRGEKARTELRRIVEELQTTLTQLRRDSRAALLTSKRTIDSQSRSQREELLSSSVVNEKVTTNEKVTEDALMKANDNVTDALRRTIDLMQGELQRSVLSVQMLDESTATLRATSTTHDTLTNLMGTSKQLITALEKSDWMDRALIISAFIFFLLVILFILKQRILDRSIRLAFWWTRFLPDFGGDTALVNMEKGVAPSSATVISVVSSAIVASGTSLVSTIPTPLIPPAETGITVSEALASLNTLLETSSSIVPSPSSVEDSPDSPPVASPSVVEHIPDEPHRNPDEL
ncbi:hypothetical protein H0H92_003743 [Tricholoma furcatifolium]|nr:hypothetical protein H0H92_003743 [Tricholoma furcatifolium]